MGVKTGGVGNQLGLGQAQIPALFARAATTVPTTTQVFAISFTTWGPAGAGGGQAAVYAPPGSEWVVGVAANLAIPAPQILTGSIWHAPTINGVYVPDAPSVVNLVNADGLVLKENVIMPYTSPAGGVWLQLGLLYTTGGGLVAESYAQLRRAF